MNKDRIVESHKIIFRRATPKCILRIESKGDGRLLIIITYIYFRRKHVQSRRAFCIILKQVPSVNYNAEIIHKNSKSRIAMQQGSSVSLNRIDIEDHCSKCVVFSKILEHFNCSNKSDDADHQKNHQCISSLRTQYDLKTKLKFVFEIKVL